MKIRLKNGFGPITNSKMSLYPGQIVTVEEGTPFDTNVIEVVEIDGTLGLETFDDIPEDEDALVEEIIIADTNDFKEIVEVEEEDIVEEKKVIEPVKEVKNIKLTKKMLTDINGIGNSTANKILKIAKTSNEFFQNEQKLRDELRDDYVDKLIIYFKGE